MTTNRLKQIASLKRKRYRDELGQTLVEGVRSVKSLFDSDARVVDVIVNSGFDVQQYSWLSEASMLHVVSPKEFQKISDVKNSQGIIAVAQTNHSDPLTFPAHEKVLVLDGISDPGNAGTIVRSAVWYGIKYIIAGNGTVDLYNPKVVRASMGGVWEIEIGISENLTVTLAEMKTNGCAVYSADLEGTDLASWSPSSGGVMVIGNEAHGVSRSIIAISDECVTISGYSASSVVESLNAAVSCAVILDRWAKI